MDFSKLEEHLNELIKNISEVEVELQEKKIELKEKSDILEKVYIELMKKKDIIDRLKEEAEKRAKTDANKVEIETTAEGKSFLSARFKFWINKLSTNWRDQNKKVTNI